MNVSPQTMQRLLTRTEQATFLAKHPVVATMVAETKAAILAGLYDWNYYDNYDWMIKFPGIIEPIGIQVQDSAFGLVTIQPARNGEIYFSGWTDTDLNTDNPFYRPPPHERGPLDDLRDMVIGAVVVGVVGIAIAGRRNKRG